MPSSKTAIHHRHANQRAEGLGETVVVPAGPRLHYLRQIRLAVRVVPWSYTGTGLAQQGFGRTGVEARSQGFWLGAHQPLLTVDEFAGRVEVSGVTGGLGDHMEQDIPKIVEEPLTPGEGPPGQGGIWDEAAMTASARNASCL